MKKLYTIITFGFLLILGGKSFSQTSFKFKIVDTVVVGAPLALGDIEIDGNYILNKTSSSLTIDVVRMQNVGGTWTSAFCLDICYADFVDSVQFTILANDSVPFIPHFYIDATPDSQTIYMKVKSVATPTDVAYQRFHGITQVGFGVHEYANLANVSVYPSPVVAKNDFNMNITNIKGQAKEISLLVYNIYGDIVIGINNLKQGNNTLNLDLAAGMYSYSLIAGEQTLRTGKLTVVK